MSIKKGKNLPPVSNGRPKETGVIKCFREAFRQDLYEVLSEIRHMTPEQLKKEVASGKRNMLFHAVAVQWGKGNWKAINACWDRIIGKVPQVSKTEFTTDGPPPQLTINLGGNDD